jgi:hypothetical protein
MTKPLFCTYDLGDILRNSCDERRREVEEPRREPDLNTALKTSELSGREVQVSRSAFSRPSGMPTPAKRSRRA